jgi:beta-lactam-binding protein with PASTA domain
MTRIRRITVGLVAVAILSLGLTLPASAAVVRETVPNVVKDSDATATAVVKARHLVPKFVGGLHGVYAQSIKAGTVVNEGTTVTLDTYEEVPNVVGLTWTSAEAVLKSRSFVNTHYGSVATKVYGESLAPGKLEVMGTRITIDTWQPVPNVGGLTWPNAEATLKADHLDPVIPAVNRNGGTNVGWQVWSTYPVAGTLVKLGSPVLLEVRDVLLEHVGGTALQGTTTDPGQTTLIPTFTVPAEASWSVVCDFTTADGPFDPELTVSSVPWGDFINFNEVPINGSFPEESFEVENDSTNSGTFALKVYAVDLLDWWCSVSLS